DDQTTARPAAAPADAAVGAGRGGPGGAAAASAFGRDDADSAAIPGPQASAHRAQPADRRTAFPAPGRRRGGGRLALRTGPGPVAGRVRGAGVSRLPAGRPAPALRPLAGAAADQLPVRPLPYERLPVLARFLLGRRP